MMGYKLTEQEVKWVNEIQAQARQDLKIRGFEFDEDYILTTAILGVTFFTRELKLVNKQ